MPDQFDRTGSFPLRPSAWRRRRGAAAGVVDDRARHLPRRISASLGALAPLTPAESARPRSAVEPARTCRPCWCWTGRRPPCRCPSRLSKGGRVLGLEADDDEPSARGS